jgi:glucokinase
VRILVGDIGGTKTLLALVTDEGRPEQPRRYECAEYPTFDEVLSDYLGDTPVDRICLGVAGPVKHNRVQATNLPWVIDGDAIARDRGIPVAVINDFYAVAAGIPELRPDELVTLNPGQFDPEGPIAVLGAGTGLGEGFLVPTTAGHRIIPTEGGHTDFAPRNEPEIGLLRYLLQRHHRVSIERILSGAGLAAVYDFLKDTGFAAEGEAVRAAMTNEDRAAVISRFALDHADPLCERALGMFAAIYGSEAGNLALKVLATGGVYVAGGIAPKILAKLRGSEFIGAFMDKGRMSPLVAAIPLHVVLATDVGLLGAAAHARQLL